MSETTHDLRCELNFEMRPDGTHTAFVEQWFRGALSLFPGVMDRLLTGPELNPAGIKGGECGPPGSAWGFFDVERAGARGIRSTGRVITPANQDWFLGAVRKGCWSATAGLSILNERGTPGKRLCRVMAQQVEEADWLSVRLEVPMETFLHDQDSYLQFMRSVAEDCNPSFGAVSYAYNIGETALELTLGPPWVLRKKSIPASRTYLRGYDWLTICAQELGDRLAGLQGLRAGGSFHTAEKLASGGYWLLATPRHEEYDEDATRRVWQSVAPVLRPGVPKRMEALRGDPPLPVVYEAI